MRITSFRLTEQQQFLLIIVAAIGVLLGIWFGLLGPMLEKRAENARTEEKLSHSPYARYSMDDLLAAAAHETQGGETLQQEWKQTADRLGTFPSQHLLRASEMGRIDYKKELFDTRARLIQKSETLDVQLDPLDLGLVDALGSNDEEIRIRMLQLRSVERLADLALDRRIARLRKIDPLAPLRHTSEDAKTVFTEFPVKADFDIGFDNLFILFQAVFEEGQIFVFRDIRIESGALPQDPLRVKATLSALLFE
ncbi:MAG: hypothetical protein ACOX5G_00345 [Kiritimatiellia bacterium]|jgi:hypothetical protein